MQATASRLDLTEGAWLEMRSRARRNAAVADQAVPEHGFEFQNV